MLDRNTPNVFRLLLEAGCIAAAEIVGTPDGFFLVHRSIASILASKDVLDFLDSRGERHPCSRFFDDWFLYAVPEGDGHVYSLLKLREQEHDGENGAPADGDTPGVTISFIAFTSERLLACLEDPSDENRKKLNAEINRVVAHRGQRHHEALKQYFKDPGAQGAYLVADIYVKTIASFADHGTLQVPDAYRKLARQQDQHKKTGKSARLPRFVEELNQAAGRVVCDHENLYFENPEALTEHEALAILATHTGNTSVYSFGAEVEYHARFLTPMAKLKLPFLGRSVYDSAIRADMTVGDTEFQGPAPFYKSDSKIVKRQYALHRGAGFPFALQKK